jgi:hypothetical protein
VQCAVAIRDALVNWASMSALAFIQGTSSGVVTWRAYRASGPTRSGQGSVRRRPGVSRTVVDLVVGSDLHFVDRGEYELKGLRASGESSSSGAGSHSQRADPKEDSGWGYPRRELTGYATGTGSSSLAGNPAELGCDPDADIPMA